MAKDNDIFGDAASTATKRGDADIFKDVAAEARQETKQAEPEAPVDWKMNALKFGMFPGAAVKAGVDVLNNGIEKAAYNVGGAVTDKAASILPVERTNPLQSLIPTAPEVGYLANLGTQFLPTLAAGNAAQKLGSPAMESGAQRLMQMALKPSLDAHQKMASPGVSKAQQAVETLLKEGFNPTDVAGMESRMGILAAGRAAEMAKSGATIPTKQVADYVPNALEQFKYGPNADEAVDALGKVQKTFLNHPEVAGQAEIPIQLAEKLKQGYQAAIGKKYGAPMAGQTSAEMELAGEKQIARGLRELQAQVAPQTAESLSREAALINAKKLGERRAAMTGNNQIMGLGWIANPMMWPMWLAERSPTVGGLMARGMYQSKDALPFAAGAYGAGRVMAPQGVAPGEDPMLDLVGILGNENLSGILSGR